MRWIAGITLGLSACGGADLGPARFEAGACHLVEVFDEETGDLVVGAEDIALSGFGTSIWVSAYDRLADVTGGVYELQLPRLSSNSAISSNVLPGSKPHGIYVEPLLTSVDGDDGGFGVIDHNPQDGALSITTWDRAPSTMRKAGPTGEPLEEVTSNVWEWSPKALCAANDFASFTLEDDPDTDLLGPQIKGYVTLDRSECERRWWHPIIKRRDGAVADFGTALTVRRGLALPNGIAVFDEQFWVAEMRGKRLTHLESDRTIPLPGAPDNLNTSDEGIVAALQPSLWRFGLYRYGHAQRAATRIVLVDPDTEEIELLFEDPSGKLFSGATAAVLGDDFLVASSVRGQALLVCGEPG